MKNEAWLRHVKRAFGTRREKMRARHQASVMPNHTKAPEHPLSGGYSGALFICVSLQLTAPLGNRSCQGLQEADFRVFYAYLLQQAR